MALDGGAMEDAGIQPDASAARFVPYSYKPLKQDAPFFKALYYLNKNPLELLTEELYETPVSEKTFLGRRAFFLNDPALTRYFFSDRSDIHTIDPVRKLLLRPGFGSGLASIDGEDWAENRALTKRYFKADYLSRYAEIFHRSARDSCAEIRADADLDLQAFLSQISLRSALMCLFSTEGPFTVEKGVNAFNDVMKYHMTVEAADIFLLPHIVPRLWKRGAKQPLRTCRQLAKAIVESRLADRGEGREDGDLLAGYFRAWIAGDQPTRHERKRIEDNVGTMLGASFETTSLSMTWTLYFLLNCPTSEENVRSEIAEAPHEGEPLSQWPRILPRTTAALMETMRVYPILPAIVRYATEGDAIEGASVRPGDFIVANLWTQHRDERHWPDADSYRPERFLHREARGGQGGYFPFGIGPRACVGTQFAMLEAVIVLATLLDTFEVTLLAPGPVKPQWRGTLRPDRPIPVRLRRRATA